MRALPEPPEDALPLEAILLQRSWGNSGQHANQWQWYGHGRVPALAYRILGPFRKPSQTLTMRSAYGCCGSSGDVVPPVAISVQRTMARLYIYNDLSMHRLSVVHGISGASETAGTYSTVQCRGVQRGIYRQCCGDQ